MYNYLLKTGKIIPADDPSWINEDIAWEYRNDALFRRGKRIEYETEETKRKLFKYWYMENHDISKIIYND